MKKYVVFLIPLLLLLSRCKKDKTTYIKTSGKVLEYGSNKPIKNAKVGIIEEGGEFLGSSWTQIIDTTRTDADGAYHFDKGGLSKGSTYSLSAVADKYYASDLDNYNAITGQEVTNRDIVLDPFAWIRVHVKNAYPFDGNDRIILGNIVGEATTSGDYTGKEIELNYINKIFGNRAMEAHWSVSKNGIVKSFVDTVKIMAHDTLNYEILY